MKDRRLNQDKETAVQSYTYNVKQIERNSNLTDEIQCPLAFSSRKGEDNNVEIALQLELRGTIIHPSSVFAFSMIVQCNLSMQTRYVLSRKTPSCSKKFILNILITTRINLGPGHFLLAYTTSSSATTTQFDFKCSMVANLFRTHMTSIPGIICPHTALSEEGENDPHGAENCCHSHLVGTIHVDFQMI